MTAATHCRSVRHGLARYFARAYATPSVKWWPDVLLIADSVADRRREHFHAELTCSETADHLPIGTKSASVRQDAPAYLSLRQCAQRPCPPPCSAPALAAPRPLVSAHAARWCWPALAQQWRRARLRAAPPHRPSAAQAGPWLSAGWTPAGRSFGTPPPAPGECPGCGCRASGFAPFLHVAQC